MDRDFSNERLVLDSGGLPDLFEWERRPGTQVVPEKTVISSPYVGGSKDKPRDIRTLRRWRTRRRGPSFLKIGGRYFYTPKSMGHGLTPTFVAKKLWMLVWRAQVFDYAPQFGAG